MFYKKAVDNISYKDIDQYHLKTMPKRFLLASLLIFVGFGVDIAWLENNAIYIISIRSAMVLGTLSCAMLLRYFQSRIVVETVTVVGVLSIVFAMANIGYLEGTYLTGYMAAVYQLLAFTAIFIPVRTSVFAVLTITVGLLWFFLFPFFISLNLDERLLLSHQFGYITYAFMTLAGNRLFLRVLHEQAMRMELMRKHTQHLEKAVVLDGLTEVYNYRHFQDIVPLMLEEATANKENLSICLIDLDGFKSINDKFGHLAGNDVLKHVAYNLKIVVREKDGVFRLGGDEFAVVTPAVSASDAKKIAERFKRVLNTNPFEQRVTEADVGSINCSIGIADLSTGCITLTTLLEAADSALYRAKSMGQNQIVCAQNNVEPSDELSRNTGGNI